MTDSTTMRERFAAQSVIEELLHVQQSLPRRSVLARVFGASPLAEESESWYAGAKGEIAVASLLAKLPPEWTVFHALPVGTEGSDIDHLVVGPGGVFTINTKHHSGKHIWVGRHALLVSGRATQYLRHAEYEAARVTKLMRERMPLLPPVQPVIALVDPKQVTVRERPAQVRVIDARHLRTWLTRLAVVMNESELDLLVDILDDPATWHVAPFSASAEAWEQFNALDNEVRSARMVRAGWALAGTVALVAASVTAFPLMIHAMTAGLLH